MTDSLVIMQIQKMWKDAKKSSTEFQRLLYNWQIVAVPTWCVSAEMRKDKKIHITINKHEGPDKPTWYFLVAEV